MEPGRKNWKPAATAATVVALWLLAAFALFNRQDVPQAREASPVAAPTRALTEEDRAYESYLRAFSGGCSELLVNLETACEPLPRGEWAQQWQEDRRLAAEDAALDQCEEVKPEGDHVPNGVRGARKPERPKRRPSAPHVPRTKPTPTDDPLGDWPFID